MTSLLLQKVLPSAPIILLRKEICLWTENRKESYCNQLFSYKQSTGYSGTTGIEMAKISTLPRFIITGLIKIYRYCISPLTAGRCRFYPTCSAYALEALDRHGLLKGSFLTVKRLFRCHPWHPGGFDPVPERPDGLHHAESDNHTYQPVSVARKSWICKEHS